MTFQELKFLWYADLYRYGGKTGARSCLSQLLFNPGYKYMACLRLCAYLRSARPAPLMRSLFWICRLMMRRYQFKYGIFIPYRTAIGSGMHIGHCGGIHVNYNAVIGKNCNISQDVTLGEANRGPNKGFPVVGDNVYIGPGAKLVGAVRVGNNVAIGANCVVTKDVPDNAVVAGVPGKVISMHGSAGYINHTDYEGGSWS